MEPMNVPLSQLISRAQQGDEDAYEEIVARYWRAAFASAYSVLGNRSIAEEIAQDTFIQVWEKLDRLREPKAFTGWVWRISRDLALKHIRKHKRMRLTPDAEALDSADQGTDPLLESERDRSLREAINELPDDMRDVVMMKFWEGLDYDEMSARTGISNGALYQRVSRGLKLLRGMLDAKDIR